MYFRAYLDGITSPARGVLFSKVGVNAMEVLTGHNLIQQVPQVEPRKSCRRMASQVGVNSSSYTVGRRECVRI